MKEDGKEKQEALEEQEKPKLKGKKGKEQEKNQSSPEESENPSPNEIRTFAQTFLAESSDKGVSAQYFRPNLQPIYQNLT